MGNWIMMREDCFVRKTSESVYDVLVMAESDEEGKTGICQVEINFDNYTTYAAKDLLYLIGEEDRYREGMLPGDPILPPELWAKEMAEAGYCSGLIRTPAGDVLNTYQLEAASFAEAKRFCLELGAEEAAACF